MGAKLVEKVKDGGGATEAAAVNALAKAARTTLAAKVAAESLVLPRRKRVLKMVWNYMVEAVAVAVAAAAASTSSAAAAAAASTSFRKKKISPAKIAPGQC